MLKLKPIHEIVPVYEKRARVTVDLVVANTGALMRELARTPDVPTPIAVAGRLTYQACDDKVCYTPASVPLTWNLLVRFPDQKRARPDRRGLLVCRPAFVTEDVRPISLPPQSAAAAARRAARGGTRSRAS